MTYGNRCTIALAAALLLAGSAGPARGANDDVDISGDFRIRFEQDFDSQNASGVEREDRLRARIRARVAVRYSHGDHVSFGVRARSGSDLSHQSPHVTVVDFDDNDTGDADFNLDKWYLRGEVGRFWSWAGRSSHPFWRQNEMLFDDDATPAGIAVGWKQEAGSGTVSANAGYFSLPVGMQEFSGNLGGLQLVYAREADVDFTAAAGLYDFEAQPDDPDAAVLLNGNGFRDYSIVQVSAQVRLQVDERPLTLGVDAMTNTEDYSATDPDPFTVANRDETDGYVILVRYGGLGERGRWAVEYDYARIETFAVNASYAEDDWVRWGSATETRASDVKGHEARVAWRPSSKANVLFRLYLVESITTIEDGSRARIDLNYRF